jgi:prepilin-type N-terminal cleavage/methylation domain-containing protein
MHRRGYTLIELLVVIGIIGILATLGTYAWAASGKRSRDSVRKTDISRLNNALQQHYLDNRVYPEYDSARQNGYQENNFLAGWQLEKNTACSHVAEKQRYLAPKYISAIPQDPKTALDFGGTGCGGLEVGTNHYLYLVGPKGSRNPRDFMLLATLEASSNDRTPDIYNPVSQDYQSSGPGDKFAGYNLGNTGNQEPNFYNPNYLIKGSLGR